MIKHDANMWDKLERLEKLRAKVKVLTTEISFIEGEIKPEIRTYMNRHLSQGA